MYFKHSLQILMLLLLILPVFLPIALAQSIILAEVIETFDDNTTRYAYAYMADFREGKAVFIENNTQSIGFIGYTGLPEGTKDIMMSACFRVSNSSTVAIWITSTDASDYIGDEITPSTDLRKTFVGAGFMMAVTQSNIYLRLSDSTGVTFGSLLYVLTSADSYALEIGEDYTDYYVAIRVARVSATKWLLTVYVGNTQIYSGNIWSIDPKYIIVVGGGIAFSQSVYLDIITIVASTFSPYEVIVPSVPSPAIAVAPSLLIIPYNSTALCILYMCYYRVSPAECPTVTVRLLFPNGSLIYEVTIVAEETESHLYTFRDVVVPGVEEVEYEVYINGELYRSGIISIPSMAPLYTNPYTELIAALIPVAIVVSLGVKTSSIRNIGLGLVASGLALMLLPLLGVFSPNLYVAAMLCMAIGGLILFFYRTS